jgi:DNA-binding response OmpR family regulator
MLLLQVGEKPFRRTDDGESLARRGIRRTLVQSEQDALEHLLGIPYDIVFLDLDSPRFSGCEFLTTLRRVKPQIPIFTFTTESDLRFRIKVLDLGADDVMTALCPIDELLARVRSVLRRLEGHPTSGLCYGPLEVLMDVRQVLVNNVTLRLTPTEYRFVELLVRKRGSPVTKEACLAYLYADREEPDAKAIDVLLSRVRKKLASAGAGDIVKNVWGFGYKLEIDPPKAALDMGGRRADDGPPVKALTMGAGGAPLPVH